MRLTWLIEAGVYGADADPLIAEIRRQGMAVERVPHAALGAGRAVTINGVPLKDDDCVLGYGTFPFARQIQLHHRWLPGAWCSEDDLDCATYYAHFGQFLLNEHYVILPGVEAIRLEDWLFTHLGNQSNEDDPAVFIRPTGCQKLFVGQRVERDQFRHALGPARFDPRTLVVVAESKPIEREWRLLVVDDEVIAGSQYAYMGVRSVSPDLPAEVRELAAHMLRAVRWRPDPAFMLDICESVGQLRLVELNGFSSSWLYASHLPTVVSRISDLASRSASGPR
jgi:hypothetical protein